MFLGDAPIVDLFTQRIAATSWLSEYRQFHAILYQSSGSLSCMAEDS